MEGRTATSCMINQSREIVVYDGLKVGKMLKMMVMMMMMMMIYRDRYKSVAKALRLWLE